jgi:AcrR family transcriptional regulator
MVKEKLSKDAWLAAGFRSLADSGPSAVQIKSLSQKLGTTKGSFYWHFKDLSEYKSAMLGLWRTKVANDVIDDITAQQTPAEQLEAVFANATRPAPEEYGGQKIETAMRAWALADPDVEIALAELDAVRLSFLKTLLDDQGLDGKVLSELIYGAYIGWDDLNSKGRVDSANALTVLKSMILAAGGTG